LTSYIELQQHFDMKINLILEQAAKDADAAIEALFAGDTGKIGAQVRLGQIIGARTALGRVLQNFWNLTGQTVRAGRIEAQLLALNNSFDWDETLLRRAYPDPEDRAAMRDAMLSSADRNVDAMLRRVFSEAIPLSRQVYRSAALSKGWMETTINSALGRGASPAELAKAVRQHIQPDVRGGVAYAARRLARTELNNTYHAQAIVHNEDKPWNLGMDWNLSKSHPGGKPDQCDLYARAEFGLGPGVFPKEQVPKKPHPQCLCYVTPKTMDADQFQQAFEQGQFSDYLNSTYHA